MISNFRRNKAGNVALIFAITLFPVLLAAGGAVDYSRMNNNKFKIQEAVDAATMAAAVHYRKNRDIAAATEEGKSFFASVCQIPDCEKDIEPNIEIIPEERITGTYVAALDTTFINLAGIKELNYTLEAEVGLKPVYHEYHIAIDMSASMGIADGDQAMEDLIALTEPYYNDNNTGLAGCAFACHENDGWDPVINGKVTNSYELAKQAGIPLREDVMLDAINTTVDTLLANNNVGKSNSIMVAAYGFSNTLQTLIKPSINSGNIRSNILNASIRRWDTRTDIIMPQLANIVGKSGLGASDSDRKKSIILITDGLGDIRHWGRMWALKTTMCDTFKNNGVRVIVLNLEYPDDLKFNWFYSRVSPIQKTLNTKLEACASDGFYYFARESQQMIDRLQDISNDAQSDILAFTK